MNKKKYLIIGTALILIIGTIYYYKFYINPSSKKFLSEVGSKFSEDGDEVLIKEFTDFDWDRVCLNRSDSMGHFVGSAITSKSIEIKQITQKMVGLAFFKNEDLVKVYGYNGRENIIISNKKYRFLTRREGNACIVATHAVLKAKTTDTVSFGTSSEIILTVKGN